MGTDFTIRVDEIQGIFNVPVDIFVPFSCFVLKKKSKNNYCDRTIHISRFSATIMRH